MVDPITECPKCGHVAPWHTLSPAGRPLARPAIVCMLCTMQVLSGRLVACWGVANG